MTDAGAGAAADAAATAFLEFATAGTKLFNR
jgi:hypothetical protein